MKKIIIIVMLFVSSSSLNDLFSYSNFFNPDTLIEPGKENPADIPIMDTIPVPPDPVEAPDTSLNQTTSTADINYAVVELLPTTGKSGEGSLRFSKVNNGIKISGEIRGLTPGLHGIHIHEFGDCSAPDAESAGGHFNPDQSPHGAQEDIHRHTGDLGNIQADNNGLAKIELIDTKISFEGINNIIGKSVVVHAGRDDLKTQPAGDSGDRILCGVIKATGKKGEKNEN